MPNMATRQGQFVNIDGCLMERDVYEIGKRIQEYDDNLRLYFVDPAKSDFNDAPFVVCEVGRDGQLYKVLESWVLDQTILERIEAADCNRNDLLAVIDGRNVSYERDRQRRYEEKTLERQDLIAHIVADHKSRYSYRDSNTGEKVTIYDDRPSERK